MGTGLWSNPAIACNMARIDQQEETSMLKYGVSMFFTDYSIAPGELGVALEQRGFESVWAPEHSHIPLSRTSPFPGGGELPKKYYDAMDPFVTLTAAAAATKTLKVGTGVCLVAQRDPIQTAKLVASIDQVSGGRFLFGIGNSWNQDELEDHGVKFTDRHKAARERVEAMKVIWTQSKAEYHGEFVNFDPMMTWPKPVQKPHPPVIVGGAFPYSARRAIRYGEGWIPQAARGGYKEIGDLIPEFRKMAAEAGRKPEDIAITVWFPKRELDLMKRYADLGVERVVFNVESEAADKVLPALDEISQFMHKANAG
jgi:probable F420-dependent oxidoreductase